MIELWNHLVYIPLYNILLALIELLPGHSVGVAIILITLLVKIVLFPLTARSIRAQRAMKGIEPELKALKEKHGEDRQALAQATLELYKKRGVNPFSGCLPILVQIPIIMGLYFVFTKGLGEVNVTQLYSWVTAPSMMDKHFLMFNLATQSFVLAALAGVTQYIQTHVAFSKQEVSTPAPASSSTGSFQEDFARSMQIQMRYVLPVVVGVISYTLPSAVALYWAVSNILSTGQEYITKR
jgi:YidC/Oxa1 family membrane protein insertase